MKHIAAEWLAEIRKLNPIRPMPRLNPECYKQARVIRENNPTKP